MRSRAASRSPARFRTRTGPRTRPSGTVPLSGTLGESYLPPPIVYTDTASGTVSLAGTLGDARIGRDSPAAQIPIIGSSGEQIASYDLVSGTITVSGGLLFLTALEGEDGLSAS
jgi:hypothetical protein